MWQHEGLDAIGLAECQRHCYTPPELGYMATVAAVAAAFAAGTELVAVPMLATAAVAVVVVLAAGIVGTAESCTETDLVPASEQGLQFGLQLHTQMAVGSFGQHRTDTNEDFVAVLHQRPPHSVHKRGLVAALLSERWRYGEH